MSKAFPFRRAWTGPRRAVMVGVAWWVCGGIAPDRPSSVDAAPPAVEKSSAETLFTKRILPILESTKPSSCSECHLSGVDLKDYIRPDQADTFAALVAGGMVDLKRPDESKLLKLIERKPDRPNLVTDKIRQEEARAFREWLRAAVADPKLSAAKANAKPSGPAIPVEVVRHARKDRVLQSFLENVWNEAGRCAACHSPDRNAEQVKKHGEKVSWIVLDNPLATFDRLVERELIDADEPAESLLLWKPLTQDTAWGWSEDGRRDRTYKQFRRFLDDYSAIRGHAIVRPPNCPRRRTNSLMPATSG